MAELSVWRLAYGHIAHLTEEMLQARAATQDPQSMDTSTGGAEDSPVSMATGAANMDAVAGSERRIGSGGSFDPVEYLGEHLLETLGEFGTSFNREGGVPEGLDVEDGMSGWSASAEVLTDLFDHSGAGGLEAGAQEGLNTDEQLRGGPQIAGNPHRGPLIGNLIDNLDDWATASAPPSPHRGSVRGRRGRSNHPHIQPSSEDVQRWQELRNMCDRTAGPVPRFDGGVGPEGAAGSCPSVRTPGSSTASQEHVHLSPHPAFPTHPYLHLAHTFTSLLAATNTQGSPSQSGCQAQGSCTQLGSQQRSGSAGIAPSQQFSPTSAGLSWVNPECDSGHSTGRETGSSGRPASGPHLTDGVQNELVATFDVLTNNFYYEVFLWIYVNVMVHPRSADTRTRLQYLALLSNQSMHEVLLNLLLGYFNGFHQGRAVLLQEIRDALTEVYDSRHSHVDPDQLTWVRELSVELGIHLNPRQMLRSFSTVVRDIIMGRIPYGTSPW